jgi:hypothetical protein
MPPAPDTFTTAVQNAFEFWPDHTLELNDRFTAWLAP